MKKINTLVAALLFVSAVVLSNQVKAQSTCAWAKKAGGTSEDYGSAVATDASGNVYQLGNFYSQSVLFGGTTLHNQAYSTGYGAEIFLVKYDSCGNVIWAKQAGGKADAHGTSITTDAAGNIYVGGYSNCDTLIFGIGTGALKLFNPGGYPNAFVVKYNSSGVAQWAQGGNGNAQVYVRGIALDGSNNVYITGSFASDTLTFGTTILKNGYMGTYTSDVFIAKFDNSGAFQWVRGGAGDGNDIGYGIGTDAAGNVYVGGTFGSTYIRFGPNSSAVSDSLPLNSYKDIFVVKYNSAGTEQWLRTAGGNDDDEALGLAADASGNVYITGLIGASSTVSFGTYSITNTKNWPTMFLAKYDNMGMDQWARVAIGQNYSYTQGCGVKLDAGANPIVIGSFGADSLNMGAVTIYNNSLTNGTIGNDSLDIFVAKYKANGNLSWARSAGGIGNDNGYALATGLNNSVYITGEFTSPSISFAGITCTLTAGTLGGAGDAFIANNISTSPITPAICLVSADSIASNNQYNMVYWDKTQYPSASTFVLYREVTSGVYKPIGSRTYASLSQFGDANRSVGPANGDPNVGSYRYKLQIIDTAGTYSALSPYHNTVYFINNGGGTFSWNTYTVEGASITPVTTFDMVRDNLNNGVWTIISSVAGTQTSLNDASYTTYSTTANWRVDANGFNCTPTLRLAGNNSTDAAKVTSHSNQNNNRMAGINQLGMMNAEFSVYPNPAKDMLNVEGLMVNGNSTLQIIDMLGNTIKQVSFSTQHSTVNIADLSEGVYTINIISNGGVVNKRMVIVR